MRFQCQKRSVYQQLMEGIRYLDVRLSLDTTSNSIYLCHGVRSISLEEFCNQLKTFLNEHRSELVIVDVNHLYADSTKGSRAPSLDEHLVIIDNLIDLLGEERIVSRRFHPSTKIRSLMKEKGRIILIYDNAEAADLRNLWRPNSITSAWPNSCNFARVKQYGLSKLASKNNERLHVMQLIATVSAKDIVRNVPRSVAFLIYLAFCGMLSHVINTGAVNEVDCHTRVHHCSIIHIARDASADLLQFIDSACRANNRICDNFNIVLLDECGANNKGFIEVVRELNRLKVELRKDQG